MSPTISTSGRSATQMSEATARRTFSTSFPPGVRGRRPAALELLHDALGDRLGEPFETAHLIESSSSDGPRARRVGGQIVVVLAYLDGDLHQIAPGHHPQH